MCMCWLCELWNVIFHFVCIWFSVSFQCSVNGPLFFPLFLMLSFIYCFLGGIFSIPLVCLFIYLSSSLSLSISLLTSSFGCFLGFVLYPSSYQTHCPFFLFYHFLSLFPPSFLPCFLLPFLLLFLSPLSNIINTLKVQSTRDRGQ